MPWANITVRNPFSSIKFQIVFSFLLLILPLFSLAYFIFFSNNLFTQTLEKKIASDQLFALTSSLQRDVVDLQRNALIYKDSASASSVLNVGKLYANLVAVIQELRGIDILAEEIGILDSIERHLVEYKNNFDVVTDYRKQQKSFIDEHISVKVDDFSVLLADLNLSSADRSVIVSYLRSARNSSLAYLADNNYRYVGIFKSSLSQVEDKIRSLQHSPSTSTHDFLEAIKAYERNFLRITTANRSYTYLINVVMAGSAKEVLYSANLLQEMSSASSRQEKQEAERILNKLRQLTVALSFFGIFLAVIAAIYFFKSIMRPIQGITAVFDGLANGRKVLEIPGIDRVDEIGLLANAANVFRQKNEQTVELLEQTKNSMDMQKKLNEDLVSAKTHVEKALSVKTDFLANMSHELRTPLNSIIGFTVRLLKNEAKFDSRELKALQAIHKNGKHLLAMINDILDLSKVEAGELSLSFVECDLGELVEVCMEQLAPVAEEKGLDLSYKGPAEDLIIVSDPLRLNQVLLNLLSNAIKYTPHGWVKVELKLVEDAKQVQIAVSDSGVGIAEENIGKLFNRFQQLDQDTQQKIGQGTGLGLAIVANISRLLGAKVDVDSQLNVGSTFTVTLSLYQAPE